MGRRNRFVKPAVIRLEISDGDWINVKRELNVGERKRMFAAGLSTVSSDGEKFDLDPVAMSFAKVTQYLTDWSLEEENEKGEAVPVELTEEAIKSLDDETFSEIEKAIDGHIKKLEKEKKAASGKAKPAQK